MASKTRPARRRRRTAKVADRSRPKTTRPHAMARRLPERQRTTAQRIGRKLDAFPDRIDARDWVYQPSLAALPDNVINIDAVPAILDQEQEGACTGFALAAVINFLLRKRGVERRVSPRMLYEMARRYDEWPGQDYEGSSARGAMKGWLRHGVADVDAWPVDVRRLDHLGTVVDRKAGTTVADLARQTPCGAFYRVMHRQVRDMHAALTEVGALYCTLMVHEGWDEPGPRTAKVRFADGSKSRSVSLPVIERRGRADGGHAVALVGYTADGFVVQNSWGTSWGHRGFALLPYEDYLLHATDVWVVQLGVPVSVELWGEGAADTKAGLARAAAAIPLSEIRPYALNFANDGALSDSGAYWTTEADLERLFGETIPRATASWQKRRVMLFLHGGLQSEEASARRIVALRDVCLANEIYPLHVMWETGTLETVRNIMDEALRRDAERATAGEWFRRLREGLVEAKDRTLELTAARPGRALWDEMKENARLASNRKDGRGGMQLVAEHAKRTLASTPGAAEKFELHVVAHSAGSIFAAETMPILDAGTIPFRTLQFMAPAIRVDDFERLVLPEIAARRCPTPSLFVLSDVGERDDECGPYGKSLLYLVSNAFEDRRETPILGMVKFVSRRAGPEADIASEAVAQVFAGKVQNRPALVIAGEEGPDGSRSRADSHGGFDNDPDTMNSVLHRILNGPPRRPFLLRDLQF
ncbi:MAG: C1 family peptidase [Acidobacteria bacterium]|nr:C1 family peptidase [Acidobacteriota bacterium]